MRKTQSSFHPRLDRLSPQYPTVQDVLEACLRGDSSAWQVFVDVFDLVIRAEIKARAGHIRPEWACHVEEEDLTGTVYCELLSDDFGTLRHLRDRSKIRSYVGSVVDHVISHALRHLHHHEVFISSGSFEIQAPARPDEVAIQHEKLDLIGEALSTLRPKEQAMIRMRYFQRMECKQIAKELGVKTDCVYKALQRLVTKLKRNPRLRELWESG